MYIKFVTLTISMILYIQSAPACIEHKALDVSGYMDSISGSQDEKTQILEYVKQSGNYLDIGSGSDSVPSIIKKTQGMQYVITLGDLENQVLKKSINKYGFLKKHLKGEKMPYLQLKQIDAINMASIPNNSLDGISASALLHEVYSYTPKKGSIDQFLSEICRTLKEDGVLVYRDPATMGYSKNIAILKLESKIAKKFFVIFAAKFFDREFSNVRDKAGKCIKPKKHTASSILIQYSMKNAQFPITSSLEEFLIINNQKIDFNEPIKIIAKRLFISEFARHYVLFINDNPNHALIEKLVDHGIEIKNNKHKTLTSLIETKINPKLITIKNDKILLDAKLLALIWRKENMKNIISMVYEQGYVKILDWLNREGEEHYFYLDLDDLITYVARYSLQEFKNYRNKDLMLVPIENKILTYPRKRYQELIKSACSAINLDGAELEIATHKNVIHFKVTDKKTGTKVLTRIAKQKSFTTLDNFIKNVN